MREQRSLDFLPTESVAVLAMVAKPLREAQSHASSSQQFAGAARPASRAPDDASILDALLVGEPHYFCETWERGILPNGVGVPL